MRKTTKQIAVAFNNGLKKKVGNTFTDGAAVYLYGNKIVEREGNTIKVSLAGWNTVTTRERINGVLRELNIAGGFSQMNFAPYFNGREVSSNEWIAAN